MKSSLPAPAEDAHTMLVESLAWRLMREVLRVNPDRVVSDAVETVMVATYQTAVTYADKLRDTGHSLPG